MRDRALLLLIVVLFWSACKNDADIVDPGDETPHFSVRFSTNMDSSAENLLVAGLENIYLFTSYNTNQQGIITCVGTFADVQCPSDTCAGSLTFEFRNTQTGQVGEPETVFHLGEYQFKSNNSTNGPTVYRTTFSADTASGQQNFSWFFNNQFLAEGSHPTFDFSSNMNSVRVKLQATSTTGITSNIERRISLITPDTLFPSLDILISPQANTYRLEALSSGAAISGLMWSNGDTALSFQEDLLQPDYTVTALDVLGDTSNVASARLQGLPPNPGRIISTTNFIYSSTLVTSSPDTLQFGKIAIQWVNEAGQIWRSDQGSQDSSAIFQVLETSPYELNEKGQKTWEMKVAFTCYLYGNGQRIPFSGTGVIAVAYP